MRPRPLALLAALAALGAGTGACAGLAGKGEPGPDAAERGLTRLLSERDLRGEPVPPPPAGTGATIVVVFASWCEPCRHELSALGELVAAEPRLRVLGINAYEDWDDRSNEPRMRKFLADHAPWLDVVVRGEQRLLDAFGGIPKVPTLFVYDAAGKVVREFRRSDREPPTREELEVAVAAALR